MDKNTLRHNVYKNIWSLGDCSSLPNSKTAAAIFSQTKHLVKYIYNNIEIYWLNKQKMKV